MGSDKVNLGRKAYNYIKSNIINGRFPTGSVISETSLAKRIGISRTPVREAIRQLSHEGMLNQVPKFGTVVKGIDLRDIVELSELREALEPYAAEQCVERINDGEIKLLKELCDEIFVIIEKLEASGKSFLSDKESKKFLAIDLGFHMTIVCSAGNRRIREILVNARMMARLFAMMGEITLDKLKSTHKYHLSVYQAIRDRDGGKARHAMHEHIMVSKKPSLQEYNSYRLMRGNVNENISFTLEDVISECGLNDLVYNECNLKLL